MEMNTQDCLKKALLDTQERVRDCMNYSEQIKEKELKSFFAHCAQEEGKQARQLQEYLTQWDK